jgi:hypothetical protein
MPNNILTFVSAIVLLWVGSPGLYSTLYAQLSVPLVQQWTDNERDFGIQFSHNPQKLIADSPSVLNFNVKNLTTGQKINNLRANIVIVNDFQRASKFLNIPVSSGDFSLKYSFPYNGHNQILVNLKRNSFGLALASFDVSVSAPAPSTDLLFEAILLGVGFPATVMLVILALLKEKRGK